MCIGNVLVDVKDDLSITCVICDFGFANFSSDCAKTIVAGFKKPTNSGITAKYAAPEASLYFKMSFYNCVSFCIS